jgi:hypothetical protein
MRILFKKAPTEDLNFCRLWRIWLPGVTLTKLKFLLFI